MRDWNSEHLKENAELETDFLSQFSVNVEKKLWI